MSSTSRKLPSWFSKQDASTKSNKEKSNSFRKKKKEESDNRITRTVYCMSPEEFLQYAQKLYKETLGEDTLATSKETIATDTTLVQENLQSAHRNISKIPKLELSDNPFLRGNAPTETAAHCISGNTVKKKNSILTLYANNGEANEISEDSSDSENEVGCRESKLKIEKTLDWWSNAPKRIDKSISLEHSCVTANLVTTSPSLLFTHTKAGSCQQESDRNPIGNNKLILENNTENDNEGDDNSDNEDDDDHDGERLLVSNEQLTATVPVYKCVDDLDYSILDELV